MSRLSLVLAVVVAFALPAHAGHVTVTDTSISILDQITFDTGKATIKRDSYPMLDAIVATLDADKKITLLEIQVHSDERGDAQWNLKLTQQRASAIRAYLVAKGIDSNRLRATGYGESRPLDKHHDAKAWAKNRRTELVILQRTS
jgi:outer membrane protein OmpA-like peptidoglycan-associated protein